MRRTVALVALAVLVTGTSTLQAQGRRERDRGLVELEQRGIRGGLYLTGGIGGGAEQFMFDDEEEWSEKLTKPTLTLRIGGTPDQYVRVGAELFGWTSDEFDSEEYFATLLGTIQFYPMREAGLWLKGGLGMAYSGQSYIDNLGYLVEINETGFGWSVGAGYELQLSRSIGIGPSIELYQGSFSQRNEPTLNERVLNIGGQITFQTGGRRR